MIIIHSCMVESRNPVDNDTIATSVYRIKQTHNYGYKFSHNYKLRIILKKSRIWWVLMLAIFIHVLCK